MNKLRENFFYALLNSIGYLLFKTNSWIVCFYHFTFLNWPKLFFKSLSCVWCINCIFFMSYTFRVKLHPAIGWISRNFLLETGAIRETWVTAIALEPQTTLFVDEHSTKWLQVRFSLQPHVGPFETSSSSKFDRPKIGSYV